MVFAFKRFAILVKGSGKVIVSKYYNWSRKNKELRRRARGSEVRWQIQKQVAEGGWGRLREIIRSTDNKTTGAKTQNN